MGGTRRRLLGLLGAALAAAPFSAIAQPAQKLHRIGILDQSSADSGRLDWWKAFRERLRELGYIEGQQVAYESRFVGGKAEQVRAFAAELVKLKVDLIVTAGTPAAAAAKQATSEIPIVMTTGTDPVAVGLVKNLARPGGNLTGVTSITSVLSGKRVELLKVFVPGVSRVGLLLDESNPASRLAARETEATAAALGMTVIAHDISSPAGYDDVFKALRHERAQAVIVISSATTFSQRKRLAELAVKHHLAAVTGSREYAQAGGLISYGTDYPHLFRRAAEYADKIFKGARPGDLPIELPSKFELVVNLKTAKALGIKIPQSVLVRADEVIQ